MTFPGRLLAARNLAPKKYMGQNFLIDPSTSEMIVRRAGVSPDDTVIEVGAGLGALSVPLARSAKFLYAVEKDRDLVEVLKDVLEKSHIGNAAIIHKNIFDTDIAAIAQGAGGNLSVFGNLPYNISSQIVMWAIEHRRLLDRGVFMFQKEVARRIYAAPGSADYSRLSVMVQYCSRVKKIAGIDAHQFYPRPKVDSEVVEIRFEPEIVRPPSVRPPMDEKRFFEVVKAAFGKRRKTLKNALAGSDRSLDNQMLERIWQETSIDPGRRAETLSVEEFVELADVIHKISLHSRQNCI